MSMRLRSSWWPMLSWWAGGEWWTRSRSSGDSRETFSHREKGAAEQPDEGLRRGEVGQDRRRRNPSPARCAGTVSLWERVRSRVDPDTAGREIGGDPLRPADGEPPGHGIERCKEAV